MDLADHAMAHFNFWAKELKITELTAEEICTKLRPRVDRQVSPWMILARGGMLAVFGEREDFRTCLDQLFQLCGNEQERTKDHDSYS
jgi:hypothetical protein